MPNDIRQCHKWWLSFRNETFLGQNFTLQWKQTFAYLPRFFSTYYLVVRSLLRLKCNRELRLEHGGLSHPYCTLHVSLKKRKGTPGALVEENSFPRQRPFERVTGRFAEWRAGYQRRRRKVTRKASYYNKSQHAVLQGYEFDYRFANFTETESQLRKPPPEIRRTFREERLLCGILLPIREIPQIREVGKERKRKRNTDIKF